MMKNKDLQLLRKMYHEDEVIDQISRECCNGDREKGEKVYQQAVKILRENTKERQQRTDKDNNERTSNKNKKMRRRISR